MNSTHIGLAGGATAALTQVLIWVTAWPLQALNENTASALAGLIIMGASFVWTLWKGSSDALPAPPPAPPAPPAAG
jgi:hypothetical protein